MAGGAVVVGTAATLLMALRPLTYLSGNGLPLPDRSWRPICDRRIVVAEPSAPLDHHQEEP